MKQWSKLLVVAAIMSGILSGCSSNDDEFVIAPVPVFESQVELNVEWEEYVGHGTKDFISKLQPTIAYGKIFASDRQGTVAAFDIEDGKEVWRVQLNEPTGFFSASHDAQLSGGVATGYDKVVIGAESGMLYVLEQETGEIVWKKQTAGEILAKPVLVENKIVVIMGNGKVIAYDLEKGEVSWTFQQEVPALSLRGTSGVIENQGAIFFGLPNGKIAGILAQDGRAIWEAVVTVPSGSNELANVVDIDATPEIFGPTMYALGYNGSLVAIELRSGKISWKRQYSGFQAMSISGFQIYLTTSDSHIYAIDRRSGLEVWNQMGLENRQVTAPVAFEGYVAVADYEGYLHLLSQETGEFVAQLEIDDDGHIATPIVDDNRLYLQSKDGLLTAISIK